MSNAEILSSLSIVSGHAVCSSRDVSRFFDKEHFHVLRDIETLLPQLSETFSKTNFGASYYETDTPTGGVRRDKMYLLSKFPPMNDDLLCNCSGQCKKEVFNG